MSSSEDEDVSILLSVKKTDTDALNYALSQGPRKSEVMERGEEGETALHWASLLGRLDMVKLLLQHGAELACPVEGAEGFGQHPIHWAASKGQLHVVDFFLRNGASIEEIDGKGCSPLLTASQNNHVTLVLFLLSRGANLQARDNDGDSALHWAAYKGQQDVCEVLISKGLDVNSLDKCSQNPLHLACVEGKPGVIDCLLDHGVDKTVVDKNGNTPLMIAKKRKHEAAVDMLENKGMTFGGMFKYFTPTGFFFGAPGRYQQQLKLFLFQAFCIGYPFYFYKILPLTLNECFFAHILFWVMCGVMWLSFWKIRRVDPGFVPCNSAAYQEGIDELMRRDNYEDLKMPDFCHACKVIRPPRSKHCKFCKRCVLIHDHHCPYLDRCIAYNNRVYFSSFIWSLEVIGFIVLYFFHTIWKIQAFSYVNLIILLNALFFCIMLNLLSLGHVLLVTGNFTTYECAASSVLPAFRMFGGRYHNPYKRSVWDNILEYFHLKAPLDLRTIQPVTVVQSV
ncbi:uncharacterized protein LOC135809498 isoform X2 [Sycon ciliatum]|uniref:uncharacterized protein LOC135809498 isoform X2 n=1 Tax=Sycon ciliatum TaxID=27933 RepID=UPI0031F694E9